MRFTVVSPGNHSTSGCLFFSLPKTEEIDRKADEVEAYCSQSLKRNFDSDKQIEKRLDYELNAMRTSQTSIYFLILKEIADCSKEYGYSIMTSGELCGSLIAYLLGLTDINPNEQICGKIDEELFWVKSNTEYKWDFSSFIASPIRPLIHSRLDKKYGSTKGSSSLYQTIGLANLNWLSQIKLLNDKTSVYPTGGYQDPQVLNKVLSGVVMNHLAAVKEMNYMNSDDEKSFLESLQSFEVHNFYELVRTYGYIYSSRETKSISDLTSQNCLIFRDDLFAILKEYGYPADDAYEFCKYGLWSRDEQKEEYAALLAEDELPEPIIEQFEHTSHLWCKASCIERAKKLYTREWYAVYHATEYKEIMSKSCCSGC